MKRDVAVDLDGVLAQYDGWKGVDHFGAPIPGAREFLAALRERWNVVVFTARCNPEIHRGESADSLRRRVEAWLRANDLPFDHVWTEPGKPLAFAFVDDRAVSVRPQDRGPVAFDEALARLDALARESVVVTSGACDPFHPGHASYIAEAAKLGGRHIHVLNADSWLQREKGREPILSQEERAVVIGSIAGVDEVMTWDDGTRSIAGAIREIRRRWPKARMTLAKGGDRRPDVNPIPEEEVDACRECDVRTAWDVGLPKRWASSEILARLRATPADLARPGALPSISHPEDP